MTSHTGWRTASRVYCCWQTNGLADHYIQPDERYFYHNDHGTIMRFCSECIAEQDRESHVT